MRSWTESFDMSSIPEDVLKSEWARRCSAKRTGNYTGGVYWKEHNPETARCRCKRCMDRREKERDNQTNAS